MHHQLDACSTPADAASDDVVTSQILMRPEAGAQYIDISRTRIYDLMASGEIESIKIGRCRRIPRAALDAYVERLRAEQSVSA